jgi:putative hemolysin
MPTELAVVFILILLNAFFALSEMAVMTARKNRLRQLAKTSSNASIALHLAERPERFLSSVQVYLTVLTVLSGYFGGQTLGVRLGQTLAQFPSIATYANEIGVGISVGLISMAFILLGELLPKRIAIVAPERIATLVALPMQICSTAAKPFVVALATTTEALLRLLGIQGSRAEQVTEEEIKHLVAEGAEQGIIDESERNMVNRALSFGDRTVDSLMTPRTQITWLDTTVSLEDNVKVMQDNPYSRYPVKRGSEHDVLGVLQIKTLTHAFAGRKVELFRELLPPLFVSDTTRAMTLLEKFRDAGTPLALVVDEYGDIQGMVTLNDLLAAVFGRVAQTVDHGDTPIVERANGSWLVDGFVALDDLRDLLQIAQLPHENEQDFRTAAGMVMAHFGRIPQVGEHFSFADFRFEVIDLDGARIDKILIERISLPNLP